MLLYNKKIYVGQSELEDFYQNCKENYKTFKFDLNKSKYKTQIMKRSFQPEQDIKKHIKEFDEKYFMRTSGDIFGYIIGRSYTNSNAIHYVDLESLWFNLMTYYIESVMTYDNKPNFDLKHLGNEFIKNRFLTNQIKFEQLDYMIEFDELNKKWIYQINPEKYLDQIYVEYFAQYLLGAYETIIAVGKYFDIKSKLDSLQFDKSNAIMLVGFDTYHLKNKK